MFGTTPRFRLLVGSLLWWLAPLVFTFGSCSAQTLLVVHADGFFPPNEMMEGERARGVHMDLVRAAATRLGMEVEFRSYPWKRAMAMIKRGDADAITYMGKTPEREEYGIFLEGNLLSHTRNGFFTQKEQSDKIHFDGDLQALKGYTIGTIRGRVYYADFDQSPFLQKDDGAGDEEMLLKKLIGKRVDIALASIPRIRYLAQQLNVSERIVLLEAQAPPISNYLVFAKAKGHEALAQRFAGAMEAVKKSAAFQSILKRYQVRAEDL